MEFTNDIEFDIFPTVGKETTINYNGFLSNSDTLTIVYGFGEAWNQTTYAPMEKTASGFSAKITILEDDTFNFCFQNSNNEWDNNSNCNYICAILPKENNTTALIDIDAIIEELLQSSSFNVNIENEEVDVIQPCNEPLNLGLEISNILSQIDNETQNSQEYSSLDEFLPYNPVELFENNEFQIDNNIELNIQENVEENNKTNISENIVESQELEIQNNNLENTPENKISQELIPVNNKFTISSRKLNRFYSMQKKVKLALYKVFVKFPKMILGLDE